MILFGKVKLVEIDSIKYAVRIKHKRK
jgi:hypothetical protein